MSKLYVRVSDTPETQSKGLMFVKNMPRDHGMLFSFSRQQQLRFWGENTFLPLDIAFVDNNGVIRKISKIAPMSKKTISCDAPCKYAIEANDGFFAENRIEVGDKVFFEKEGSSHVITFGQQRRNCIRTSGTSKVRQILAQLMGDEQAYGLQPQQEAQPVDPNSQMQNAVLPTISKADFGQFLEDDMEETQDPFEIEPPEKEEEPVPTEPQEVQEPTHEYPSFNNAFDALDWANQNDEVVRINYTTKKGTPIVRDIEPHGSFHSDSTGKEIAVTFDETVGDIRAFIMQNIKSFSFIGSRFEPKFKVA